MAAELPYSPEVLALWNEKDEEASEKWRQEKIKDFEASGPTKDKRETRVDMAWVPARRVPPGGWAEADRGSWQPALRAAFQEPAGLRLSHLLVFDFASRLPMRRLSDAGTRRWRSCRSG